MSVKQAISATCIAALLLSGCARGNGSADGGPTSGGSAAVASTAATSPMTPTTAPTSAGCTTGERQVMVTLAESPAPVCIHVGDTLILKTSPSPAQGWQAFVASDPGTVACTSTLTADGSATANCRALRAGDATVSTATAPSSRDPHGPLQGAWQLVVQIRA